MLSYLLKYKWPALAIFVGAFALCYLLTPLVYPKKFESRAVIFPPNTHANIHLVASGIRFGSDKEVGEYMELMHSESVEEELIKAFNLGEHYALDSNAEDYKERLKRIYHSNISINRTMNKSLEVVVRDTDFKMAAKLANGLVVICDAFKSDLVKRNVKLAFVSAKETFEQKSAQVKLMSDSLSIMRAKGEVVWANGEERKSGNYVNYELVYRKELDRLMYLKNSFEDLESLLASPVPKAYLVSKAVPNTEPVAPKKMWIALLGAVVAMGFYLAIVGAKRTE